MRCHSSNGTLVDSSAAICGRSLSAMRSAAELRYGVPLGSLAIKCVIVIALLGRLAYRGYVARRPVWTARSWWRFGALLGVGLALMAIAMGMAIGVDNGVYHRMSPTGARAYYYTLFALLIVSPLSTVALLWWFARGRPDRQL